MIYDTLNLIVGELPGVRGHLAMSALRNLDEVIVR
jgi:hypothetical protein